MDKLNANLVRPLCGHIWLLIKWINQMLT